MKDTDIFITAEAVRDLTSSVFSQSFKDYKTAVSYINKIKHGKAPTTGTWSNIGGIYLKYLREVNEIRIFAKSEWAKYISPFGDVGSFAEALEKIDRRMKWEEGLDLKKSMDQRASELARAMKKGKKPAEKAEINEKLTKLTKGPAMRARLIYKPQASQIIGAQELTQTGMQELADALETSVEYLLTGYTPTPVEAMKARTRRKARQEAKRQAAKERDSGEQAMQKKLEAVKDKPNADVRALLIKKKVPQYRLARAMGLFPIQLSRLLQYKQTRPTRARMKELIEKIAEEENERNI